MPRLRKVSLLLLLGLFVTFCQGQAKQERIVRQPAVAGSFYPDNASELSKAIDNYLQQAGKSRLPGRIIGLISPHAGYYYSGPVAAYGFRYR